MNFSDVFGPFRADPVSVEVAAERLPARHLLDRFLRRSAPRLHPPAVGRANAPLPAADSSPFPLARGALSTASCRAGGPLRAEARDARAGTMPRVAPHIGWNCRFPWEFPPCPRRLVSSGRSAAPAGFPALGPAGAGSSPAPPDSRSTHRRSGARSELDLPRDSFAGCLSSVTAAARPLPGVAPLRDCGATRNPRSALVVRATSTVFSALQTPVYCNRLRTRFAAFQLGAPFRLDRFPARVGGRSLPLPRDALRTPRRTCDPSTHAPEPHTRRNSRAASPRPDAPVPF